ncbi:Hypothetical predicted protein [Octopus vulgaris]|uniref:Uncharacterized protein n=1 Tax=Octopus vulgaris TaxID=6645 RepID=A0AA36BDH9_OCTVU|nr:Hypothetical predicted protein [Octopus vulgaris]
MSDVLHRPGFRKRLRKGARNFFSRLIPCVRRPKLEDPLEDDTDFSSPLSSDISLMTTTEEDFPRNLNQSAIIPRIGDLPSTDTDSFDEEFHEPSEFDDGSQTEEIPPCIPLIGSCFVLYGDNRDQSGPKSLTYHKPHIWRRYPHRNGALEGVKTISCIEVEMLLRDNNLAAPNIGHVILVTYCIAL